MTAKPIPRYEQIATYLRGLIDDSAPGDRLPSDAELCERFGVSRMTARQAVQKLAAEGLLERRRGAGTFVAANPVPRELGSPLSFTETMARRGMVASSQLLEFGPVIPTEAERTALQIGDGEAWVLERLRLADGVPMAVERVVMPAGLALTIGVDLERASLHEAFEGLGHHPAEAHAEVSAERASKRLRELLQLPPSGVVLSETRTIFDQTGRPLERTVTSYSASRYVFRAVLVRRREGV